MSKEAMTREKFFSEMQRIEDGLLTADALGVSPPQNWTTVAAERILSLRDDAARYRWLLEHPTFAAHCFIYLPGQVSAEIDKELAAHGVVG